MATFDDAVEREGTWWSTDTLPSWPTAAPLQAANGGRFDGVYVREPDDVPPGRYIIIDRVREGRVPIETQLSMPGRQQHHHLMAIISWTPKEDTQALRLQALERGITDVLARLRGPLLDKTHGAQFTDVGIDGDMIEIDWGAADPFEVFAEGGPARVALRYIAVDTLYL